jgi:hypothetical protein
MINAKLQSIIDTKSAIGNAIVNKGGTITGETPFFNYAAQINNISTGTPQTIFTASDGSKWARTNAVNLTNVSNNVTSDFNWWQPANNSTSNAILNIGTVGANISGNIRLVPVNQVNIAQYENIVATDTDGAKYVGYNGYDSSTNPTPTGNTTFNRWLLNNSASGTVIFANTTVTNGGTYNGPNTSINEANMAFVNQSGSYNGTILRLAINNGFIFAAGSTQSGFNRGVAKYHESNLVISGNTVNFGGIIRGLAVNNGFIYAGGQTNQTIQKFGESNLTFIGNTNDYGGTIRAVTTNNGFIFAVGDTNNQVKKFHESNLTFSANSNSYGTTVNDLAINNGYVYAGGLSSVGTVQKFHEGNLAFVGNTVSYGGTINTLKTNNGFIYVGGETNRTVQKFHESNLVFVGNTANYGGTIRSLTTNNGFIYVGGIDNQTVQKFYESNLAFVGNTNAYGSSIADLKVNNSFIYAGGDTVERIKKWNESSSSLETLSFFNITKIKE